MSQSANNKVNLTHLIEQKREQMFKTAATHGMNHQLTLKCSQELDKLILEYQKLSI
ncbi:aspartyl-phosphate phosphatase Spo0E family protein [Virgibacillus doumboii]|uniref:aspartyl-phosphate phosphatase Spo0E family protein n=1 Tax=Virgibacillus doumboii TaxID=2697503 RepID=UPI0013E0BAF4|nr:aspartyl-phosphate phosphatase Spo0E family protein [Virgibacillus doumboii]